MTLKTRSGEAMPLAFTLTTDALLQPPRYAVEDELGQSIVAETALPWSALDDTTVSLSIAAEHNTLAEGVTRGFRRVVLRYLPEDAVSWLSLEASYLILESQELVIQVNSFMGYNQALFYAADTTALENFQAATPDERITALAEAWRGIVRLRFDLSCDTTDRMTRIIDFPNQSRDELLDYSAAQYLTLDPRFIEATRRAQLYQADHLLRSDFDPREQGLLSKTVGESSQMWRSGKPLQTQVCRRALEALAGYVKLNPRLTRG